MAAAHPGNFARRGGQSTREPRHPAGGITPGRWRSRCVLFLALGGTVQARGGGRAKPGVRCRPGVYPARAWRRVYDTWVLATVVAVAPGLLRLQPDRATGFQPGPAGDSGRGQQRRPGGGGVCRRAAIRGSSSYGSPSTCSWSEQVLPGPSPVVTTRPSPTPVPTTPLTGPSHRRQQHLRLCPRPQRHVLAPA